MYVNFAYSWEMQILLALQSYFTHTIIMYLSANLILSLSSEKASQKQKLIFAFWVGPILQTTVIYGIYLIGGFVSFSPSVYSMVVSPNPVIGYLYYIIGCRVLKLSPIRSIKMMGYFYTYYVFTTIISRLLIALWPIETAPRYNYLQNSERLFVCLIITLIIYFVVQYAINKTKWKLRLSDSVFVNITKERVLYLVQMTFLYALVLTVPMDVAGSLFLMLLLIFYLVLAIMLDLFASLRNELENKEVHISVLSKAINEYSRVKHDFNNILQTYGGYLAIGSLDGLKKYHSSVIALATSSGNSIALGQRMEENPALIGLLSAKAEYAERMNVDLSIALKCRADQLYMSDLDICRCIACLMDNAIESAAESMPKKAFFTLEAKQDGSKLVIIANSTATPVDISRISAVEASSKKGHHGLGLSNVRKILAEYGNCTFHMAYYNYEFSAYIELRKC